MKIMKTMEEDKVDDDCLCKDDGDDDDVHMDVKLLQTLIVGNPDGKT